VKKLPKTVDSKGSKDAVVLSPRTGKGYLRWAEERRNKHAGEIVLPKVFEVRFQSKMKRIN